MSSIDDLQKVHGMSAMQAKGYMAGEEEREWSNAEERTKARHRVAVELVRASADFLSNPSASNWASLEYAMGRHQALND